VGSAVDSSELPMDGEAGEEAEWPDSADDAWDTLSGAKAVLDTTGERMAAELVAVAVVLLTLAGAPLIGVGALAGAPLIGVGGEGEGSMNGGQVLVIVEVGRERSGEREREREEKREDVRRVWCSVCLTMKTAEGDGVESIA